MLAPSSLSICAAEQLLIATKHQCRLASRNGTVQRQWNSNSATTRPNRRSVSKEERAKLRAARKERASVILQGTAEVSPPTGASTSAGTQAASATARGPPFDVGRWGWYALVVVPPVMVGWGLYDENSPPAKLSRCIGLTDKIEEFALPAKTKLLPDWDQIPNVPPNMPPPPVLILDLEGTLVCTQWDRKYGWRHAKRPGVDKFLSTMSQYYEIVLFTPSPEGIAIPVLDALDPKGYCMHRLHRDATHYHNGVHCKDLSWLNRPLRKIVVLDDEPDALCFQPENLIPVKPYDNPGDQEDNTLERITPLLVELAREGYDNFPAVLRQFQGMDADEVADEHERRVNEVKTRSHQRGLGSFASAGRHANMPAPELPPDLSRNGSWQGGPSQLTAKDLVGDAPTVESIETGVVGWLQRRHKQQEENNQEKFKLWNEVMMKKQEARQKKMEETQQ